MLALRDVPGRLTQEADIRDRLQKRSALPAPLGRHFHDKINLSANRHAAVLSNAPMQEQHEDHVRRGRSSAKDDQGHQLRGPAFSPNGEKTAL